MPPTSEETKLILATLEKHLPQAGVTLKYSDPYQLWVATVLSAQCTDERVNMVTPAIFARFPDPAALAGAEAAAVEDLIRSTGFFRQKAKTLKAAAQVIVSAHGGRIPDNMADLIKLPGVGRKTANVILGNAFGQPGVVVDTHVKRLAGRIGWTRQKDPDKIEQDLMAVWPKRRWTKLSHQLIIHGRSVCTARNPRCLECHLRAWCDFGKKEV